MKIKPFILALCLTFPLISNVANALTREDENQINYEGTIKTDNMKQDHSFANIHRMPTKFIENLYNSSGLPAPQFEAILKTYMASTFKDVKVLSMVYDLKKGVEGHTPQRDYIFFPVESQVFIKGEIHELTTIAMAFTDNYHWYVIGINNNKFILHILKNTYPDLKDVIVPKDFKVTFN